MARAAKKAGGDELILALQFANVLESLFSQDFALILGGSMRVRDFYRGGEFDLTDEEKARAEIVAEFSDQMRAFLARFSEGYKSMLQHTELPGQQNSPVGSRVEADEAMRDILAGIFKE